MKPPSHADAFQVLLLQAADEGRGAALFGDSLDRASSVVPPFLVSEGFPSLYLEFPLKGDPFLDVTVLYDSVAPGTRIESPAAEGTEGMLDFFAEVLGDRESVSGGFELDTKDPSQPRAAVHFQPRGFTELVEPFCEAIGEPQRATLYLDLASRMPPNWELSFFGVFRGRPDSPLRVCGYLPDKEKKACSDSPSHMKEVFDAIGFTSYDEAMLSQVSELMSVTPGSVDFQFDVFGDGRMGDTFAIDAQFAIEQPEAVWESFANGPASRVFRLMESWGIADDRWVLGGDAAFARAIPVEADNGEPARFAFALMPQWAKVRWRDGVLQPSKLYSFGNAKLL